MLCCELSPWTSLPDALASEEGVRAPGRLRAPFPGPATIRRPLGLLCVWRVPAAEVRRAALAASGAVTDTFPSPLSRMLKIVKKDEFSTKCNQTDHHRMSGGRQEVSLNPSVRGLPSPACPQ